MTIRPVRIVTTLLACIAGLVAADDGAGAGQDFHLYGGQDEGEFDEVRLHLGFAPALDRIQVKTSANGTPFPGPSAVETDKVFNDPALPPQVGLVWVLGDYTGKEGYFLTLGVEYTKREYSILYGNGSDSESLQYQSLTAHAGMGYGWYLKDSLRYEFEPFVNFGMLWTDIAVVDLNTNEPDVQSSSGAVIEGGIRNSLIWHPTESRKWHLGLSVDYRTGYGQTIYNENSINGDLRSEVRFWWYGFASSLFIGSRF